MRAYDHPAAEAILGVSFDSEDRITVLLERAKAGELSIEEAEELEHYRHVGRLLELMKSRARRSLQTTPAGFAEKIPRRRLQSRPDADPAAARYFVEGFRELGRDAVGLRGDDEPHLVRVETRISCQELNNDPNGIK